MDLATNAQVAGVIIGFTQLVKLALPKVAGWITILVAAVLGVLIALYQGGNIIVGIFDAFLAVGIVTVGQKVGGN